MMFAKYFIARTTLVVFLVTSIGCSTMSMSPILSVTETPIVLIKSPIQYDGNRGYLPRTVSEDAVSENGLTVRYATTETQDRNSWDVLALFNPLTIFGFPTGRRTSTVTGNLEILKGSDVLKSYWASCRQEAQRGIYYGESFSELRRSGLTAVRDNIETQMVPDREFIQKAAVKAVLQ